MTVGRPKEFDQIQALERAMDLFWKYGYEATGLNRLIDEMGIGRQSLYNTYGDKHALFVQAIEHYIKKNHQLLVDILEADGSPLGNIRKLFKQIAETGACGECRGCLVTNCMTELAPHDDQVASIVSRYVSSIETVFAKTLVRALEAREIPAETDTLAVARFLNNTMQGMSVMARTQTHYKALDDIVKTALSVLE